MDGLRSDEGLNPTTALTREIAVCLNAGVTLAVHSVQFPIGDGRVGQNSYRAAVPRISAIEPRNGGPCALADAERYYDAVLPRRRDNGLTIQPETDGLLPIR
jgi:hypothetical protein